MLLLLISTLGPVLIAYVANHLRQVNQRAQKEHWYSMALEFASTAVQAAEQLGLSKQLSKKGTYRFDYAIEELEKMLAANGIRIDLDIPKSHLLALIEAEVGRLPKILPAVYAADVLHTE